MPEPVSDQTVSFEDAAERNGVLIRLLLNALDRSVLVRLVVALTAVLAASIAAVAGPIMLKMMVDGIAGSARGGAAWLIGVYVAVLGVQRLGEQVQAYAFGTGEQRLQQRLNRAMFKHALSLPMSFHVEVQSGALVQTLTLGLQGARIILTHVAFSLVPLVVQLALIAVVVAALFDTALWVSMIGAIAAYGGVFALGVARLGEPTRAVMSAQVETGGAFSEGLANVEPTKALGAEARLDGRYGALLQDGELRWREFHARRFENGGACAVVFAALMGAVLLQGASLLSAGRIGVGDFVLLNAYVLQIVRPIEMAGFALRDITQGMQYLERWRSLLLIAPEHRRARVAAPPPRAPSRAPALKFEDVRFSYDGERDILKGVSFLVEEGRSLAIVGPSGAGKSSLLRLLLRYYEPRSGTIYLNGVPLEGYDLDDLRAQIAIVSQETVLFNASLEENIGFANPGADPAAFVRALQIARLEDLVARLPDGLETLVGERGLKLSGGEKQRVAIARAVLKDAPILVLDEATSALDGQNERMIMTSMLAAARERTALIVTHRLAVARHADEIVVLREGVICERGAHEELAGAGGAYAAMWAAQTQMTEEKADAA